MFFIYAKLQTNLDGITKFLHFNRVLENIKRLGLLIVRIFLTKQAVFYFANAFDQICCQHFQRRDLFSKLFLFLSKRYNEYVKIKMIKFSFLSDSQN